MNRVGKELKSKDDELEYDSKAHIYRIVTTPKTK